MTNRMSSMNLDEDPSKHGRSPISIVHELFPGTTQAPSFQFSFHPDPSSHLNSTPIWKCFVHLPTGQCGYGKSHSKKTAKSNACLDVLSKLGYDLGQIKIEGRVKPLKVESEQTVEMLPLPSLEGNLDGQSVNSRQLRQKSEIGVECKYMGLSLAAISAKIENKHGITREQNPCGYIEILCSRNDCEKPTYKCEFNDFMFVTTVTLGSWTATGSAPNKKHSKYIASASLITMIENYGETLSATSNPSPMY